MIKELNLPNIYRRKTCPICDGKLSLSDDDHGNINEPTKECTNCKLEVFRSNFDIFIGKGRRRFCYVMTKDLGTYEIEWRIYPRDKSISCSYWLINRKAGFLLSNFIEVDFIFPLTITEHQIRTIETFG